MDEIKSALHIGACTLTLIRALVLAVASDGQAQSDPGWELLGRIRHHLKPGISALPNYTCLETMERSIYHPSGRPEFFEKLRLQVLVADQGELFAWPDSTEFTAAKLAHANYQFGLNIVVLEG